jgi:hypothetical protein
MTNLGQIIDSRLNSWGTRLRMENATPLLLIGVGHEQKAGTLIVCTLDEAEMTPALVRDFLRSALRLMEEPPST